MVKPFLLLATPRAGALNHRFICSRGSGLTDETAWAWIDTATRSFSAAGDSAVGTDFVAVIRRNVSQIGGRKGDEVLLLGGIDTAAVANLAEITGKLLDRVPGLKAIAMSVSPTAKGLLIDSSELTEWLASDHGGVRAISRWKSVGVQEKSGTGKTLRYCVAAMLLLAVSAGLGATLYHLLQVPQTNSALPSQFDGHAPDPTPKPSRRLDLEALKDLAQAMQDDPISSSKELEDIIVRGKPASELASSFGEQSDPVSLLRLLNRNPVDASMLMEVLELKSPAASREVIAWRKHMQSWRAILGKLRDASSKAGLRTDDQRLKNLPLLRFLAELSGPEYTCVVDPQGASRPPILPQFGTRDHQMVLVLRKLFCESRPGKDILARLDVTSGQPRFAFVLRQLHTKASASQMRKMIEVEISLFEASGAVSASSVHLPSPVSDLAEFLEQTPPVESIRTAKAIAE